MAEFCIRDRCKVNTNRNEDTFVGIENTNGDISIHFPLGFHIAEDERELRSDIILLINTIGSTVGRKDSSIQPDGLSCNQVGFPIQAYMAIIYDFMERGYYVESEVEYIVSKKGKINWSKTIKKQKPIIQDDAVYYLDFVTRRNTVNENNLISLIHEFCVYESFEKIGWLFTGAMPQKPRIKRNDKLFLSILNEKLSRTFNDKNKSLLKNMILIIENLQDENASVDYKYGTYRFEYVWEALIDRVYGIEGKEAFFPKTTWKVNDKFYKNASLEPDSIMIRGNDIFVLDAKYYKYGATQWIGDLPESTSINKQITYGEYVMNNICKDGKVYNAFLMPFDSTAKQWMTEEVIGIGEATGEWRSNKEIYERIQGVLVDVKYLMQITVREDMAEITKLADCIEKTIREEM